MTEHDHMTVGELREALTSFPPDLPVVVETPDMEYRLVARYNPPCGDEDEAQRGVCLIPGRYV